MWEETSEKAGRIPTIGDYSTIRKAMFDAGFRTREEEMFLTGSTRFGCASVGSDLDIAMHIKYRGKALEWALSISQDDPVEHSRYNLGVKVKFNGLKINLLFLHQVDYVAWFKAATMLESSKLFVNTNLSRPLRHSIHETLCAAAKAATPEHLDATNYLDHLNGSKIYDYNMEKQEWH